MMSHKCSVSTGIHDALTFGSGRLDDYGFWEKPCDECARKAEIRDSAEVGSYWPHTEEWLERNGLSRTGEES